MRAFILVALLAMAATVSCQDVVVSPACNASSNALEVASVTDAEKAMVKTGCTDINLDPNGNQCSFDNTTSVYTCNCPTTYNNAAAWEAAVRNISNGQPCYLDLTITLTGTLKIDNTTTRTITFNTTQTNFEPIAVGGNCSAAEIGATLQASLAAGTSKINADLNAGSASSGITFTSGTVTVGACGGSRTSPSVTIPQSAGGTTAPPTTPAPGTTQPPTGSSSTGKNGASIIASSFALVAALCAAATILA